MRPEHEANFSNSGRRSLFPPGLPSVKISGFIDEGGVTFYLLECTPTDGRGESYTLRKRYSQIRKVRDALAAKGGATKRALADSEAVAAFPPKVYWPFGDEEAMKQGRVAGFGHWLQAVTGALGLADASGVDDLGTFLASPVIASPVVPEPEPEPDPDPDPMPPSARPGEVTKQTRGKGNSNGLEVAMAEVAAANAARVAKLSPSPAQAGANTCNSNGEAAMAEVAAAKAARVAKLSPSPAPISAADVVVVAEPAPPPVARERTVISVSGALPIGHTAYSWGDPRIAASSAAGAAEVHPYVSPRFYLVPGMTVKIHRGAAGELVSAKVLSLVQDDTVGFWAVGDTATAGLTWKEERHFSQIYPQSSVGSSNGDRRGGRPSQLEGCALPVGHTEYSWHCPSAPASGATGTVVSPAARQGEQQRRLHALLAGCAAAESRIKALEQKGTAGSGSRSSSGSSDRERDGLFAEPLHWLRYGAIVGAFAPSD